ncbi:MAG: hypothetical protein ACYC6Y_19015 [Thermoguttaceae bacterium]
MILRRFLLAACGLLAGGAYVAILHLAVPGEGSPLPGRGLNVVLLMGVYGWCCGKDPLLPVPRSLVEIAIFPFALLAALLAGAAGLLWTVAVWVCCPFKKAQVS